MAQDYGVAAFPIAALKTASLRMSIMKCSLYHLRNLLLLVVVAVFAFYLLPPLLSTVRSVQRPEYDSLRTGKDEAAKGMQRQVLTEPAAKQYASDRRKVGLSASLDSSKRTSASSAPDPERNSNGTMRRSRELNGIRMTEKAVRKVASHESRQYPSKEGTLLDGFQQIVYFSQSQHGKTGQAQMRSARLELYQRGQQYGWTGWFENDDKCECIYL